MNYNYFKKRSFLIPTSAFIIFLAVFLILLSTGDLKYYSLNRMLSQWDGQHYLSIARDGYEKHPCGHLPPGFICGNVGWFPVYPLVVRLLSWLPIHINWLMLIISWLSLWVGFSLIYWLAEKYYDSKTALFSLITLIIFPGSFYFLTSFPYAFYLMLTTSIFVLLDKKKYWPVIILSAMLAATYPSGIVIALPLLYILLKNWKSQTSTERLQIFSAAFVTGLALILFCTFFYFKFDEFFLYNRFQAQEFYAHSLTFPLIVIYETVTSFPYDNPIWIITVFMSLATIIFYRRNLPLPMQIYMLGILIFSPTFGSFECYYRHIVIAFPFYLMIASVIGTKYRRYLLPVYWLTSIYLLLEIYMPLYKNGQLM